MPWQHTLASRFGHLHKGDRSPRRRTLLHRPRPPDRRWNPLRRTSTVLALVLVLPFLVAVGAPASAEEPASRPTEVTDLAGVSAAGAVDVTGSAVFGGQEPVWVADDPPGDGPGMVPVGDHGGVDDAGIDLLGATLSVPDPDAPELLVEWLLSKLPPGGIPEGTRTSMAFEAGEEVYRVQAKFSNALGDTASEDPAGHASSVGGAFQLLGDCVEDLRGTGIPHCNHLAWLDGAFDQRTTTVSVRIPLDPAVAPEIAPGAPLRRSDAEHPDLSEVLAGYHVGASASPMLSDAATFGPPDQDEYAFTVPQKEVALGIAPTGTDPRTVEFSTPAALGPDDTFSGTISAEGFDDGTFDVYARACFATNCGIRSLGGLTAVGDTAVAALKLGEDPDESFVFWPGGRIGSRPEHTVPLVNTGIANCDNSPCFDYTLRVESPGAERLRIGIDAPARADNFVTEVAAPDGRSFSMTNPNSFNREIWIEDPAVGAYDILVRPYSAANTTFSMRAKLEETIPVRQPNEDGLLLPDLLPTPPYEFGFAAPVNPLNGPFLAPDDANPPGSAAGVSPVSCSWDDTAEEGVVRCLRFSFGLSNAGPGNFHVRWSGFSQFSPDPSRPMEGPISQCVERADGPPMSRPAGEFEWHASHLHTHYKDIVELELLAVTDPDAGTLEPAGDGRKIGYSPADQSLARWFSFDQNRHGTSGSAGNCAPGSNNGLGLSAGWGDVYRYQRAGNFVNFGSNPDGRYVVRLTADPEGNVLELDDTNNVSFTYIRVTGDDVEVLEYGRGMSPWDPDKEVIRPRYRGGVPW